MALSDRFHRTRPARTVIDILLFIISDEFYVAIFAIEYIQHYHKLKTGECEPYQEGEKQQWHVF